MSRRAALAIQELRDAALARPRHLVLAAVVVGLLAGPRHAGLVAFGLVGVLLAGAAGGRTRLSLAVAVALLASAMLADARTAGLERRAAGPAPNGAFAGTAIVLEPVRTNGFGGWSAPARLGRDGARVVLRARERVGRPHAGVGEELHVRGRLTALTRWERHAARRGARAALVLDAARATGGSRGGLAGLVDGVRRRAEAALAAGLPPEQAALARGMVLGQDDALSTGTRQEFRDSGLAHLLAASGQNVALLALLATGGLALLGAGLRGRLAGALALVALYVPLAGAGPSIQRAGVMGAAALVAGLAGRPGSRLYALLLAAVVTLALDPRAAGDVGWQLSFAAVVAIAVITPRWCAALVERRLPRPVAEAVALTAAATLGTAPLLALHFGTVSVVSLPSNVAATVAVAPVVWLGTGSALAGQLALLGPVGGALGDVLAGALNAVAAFPLGFVGWVAHVAAAAPHATVAVAIGSPLALAGAYAGLGALVASRRVRAAAAGASVTILAAAAWARATPPGPPRGLTVSFLDIGQGDATLIQHGARAILVDTGPADGGVVARLRAAGARRLDLLVLTHAQVDHDGAAAAVLDAMPVEAVLDGGAASDAPHRAVVEAALRRHDVRAIVPDAGQVLRVGPLRLDVFWPRRGAPPPADPNDAAIVARLREGAFELLLTADAESQVTLPLRLPPSDVLKVAHHGSADPGLPALLERVRPRLAAIEVGRGNPYGHPTPATLAALRGVAQVVRTDLDGTVRLAVDGPQMSVTTHGGAAWRAAPGVPVVSAGRP